MKRLGLLTGVILSILALKFAGVERLPGAQPVASGVAISFKAARLYAMAPDAELAMPVEGARVKQLSDTWHAPRPDGRRHEGQDIFAKRGTPVRSATDGYVLRVGESPLGGKTVFVMGAGGRAYYYAHLDSHADKLAAGDYVTTETVLGYVGTTGNAAGTPPHLHFGVYTPEGAVNPLPILKDRT